MGKVTVSVPSNIIPTLSRNFGVKGSRGTSTKWSRGVVTPGEEAEITFRPSPPLEGQISSLLV